MATLAAPPANSYDEVPYESHPYIQTHPNRLHTIGTLFGLKPTPVEKCRVLELGAAAGGNLLPMAEFLPNSEFVGVDYSQRQVTDGQNLVNKLGLKNLTLKHASILEVDDSFGQFDYVIAHGVFSWVPPAVADKILDVCSKHLTPNGIAYVSYNTYPGWHMRGMIRDMMRFHAMRFATPQHRIQQARALLDFLAQSVRQDGGPYSVLLKTELETIRHQADHYLYHEHLEEVNDPVYFHQFVSRAGKHDLRYLGEARLGTMVTGNFGPDVEKALKLLATDQIQTEQYMDFLRNRMFRESLLVNSRNVPNWTINPDVLKSMHVASSGKPAPNTVVDITTEAASQYQTRSGMTLSTGRPLLKAAMQVLGSRWPATVPFDELRKEARGLLGGSSGEAQDAEDSRNLALGVLNSYIASDLFELYPAALNIPRTPGDKPNVMASARQRVTAGGNTVANRRHEVVKLTDLDLRLVPMLDGTRDRTELVDRLTERAMSGDLNVQKDGQPVKDPAEVKAALGAVIDPALNNLALQALLL
ncbi:MAG TPA: class I SAM-dependent methyltransferase [Gemmataceae bacterium]|nr:class I SAM-dependent methyltransferase [Gemmataceae bacterium]